MSVHQVLQQGLGAALAAHAPLAGALTAIFDAPPVRARRPYALVEEALLTDWGVKGLAGREARVAIVLRDTGERPERLRMLVEEVETAVAAMPDALGEGWRVVSRVLLRSRILNEGESRWSALSEFRLRMLREN